MLNLIRNTVSNFRNSAATQSANNFLAAAGITGPTQSKAITQLVADLYSSGLWSKMKAVYPMVTDNYNLISYSEDLTNGYWSKNNLTITANAINSPFGNLTADKISEAATTGAHYMGSSAGVLTSTNTYTASSYFKAAERNWVYLYLYNGTSALGAYFNISTGVVGTVNGGVTASIIDAGNGWYRCSVSASVTGTGSSNAGITMAIADNNQSYTGVAGNGIYQFGFQLEQSSTASTYQPILTTPSAFMASQMKYNLKDARDLDAAFRLTWSGGWTYSATGATPNGTNAYADTKLAPSANFSANNSSFSFYSRTENTNGGDVMGTTSAFTNRCFMYIRYSTNQSQINHNSGIPLAPVAPTSLGIFLSSRTSLGHRYFVNNALSASNSVLETGLSTVSFYIGADNTSGSATSYTNRQVAFSHIGDGLTDQDAFLLNQIVEKYQVALSRGVQAAQSFYYNSAYSNEANTYLYSTQITGTTQVSAINTLINGLKANNLWSKMKAVYPFVTDYRNILGFTEDFGDGSWTKGNSTITTNSITAPNGTLTADSLVENVANSTHLVSNTSAITTSADNYTLSVYAKKANRDWININIYNGSTSLFAWFNLNTGTIGTVQSGLTASIIDAGNGWYRCSITRLMSASSNVYIAYNSCPSDNTNTYIGNGLVAAYIWGAQLEIGTSASTYQPVLATNNYSTNVAAQMKFNLVNPQDSDAAFRLAFSGGWTYSTNGAQPNGTNGYADTKFYPNLFTANNAHLSFYSRTDYNSPTLVREMGVNDIVGYNPEYSIYLKDNSSGGSGGILGNYNNAANSSSSNSNYYGIISRLNATSLKFYKNNTLLATNTANNNLTASALNIFLGAVNLGGLASRYSTKQSAFATIGDGLTDTEAALLYQLVQDFQTTLSRQV